MRHSFRELLNENGFDWEKGRIIYQEAPSYLPGRVAWNYFNGTVEISKDHPALDWKPEKGFPGNQMRRLVGFDSRAIYFPHAYECMDTMMVVFTSPEPYLADWKLYTPYYSNWAEKCPTLLAHQKTTRA